MPTNQKVDSHYFKLHRSFLISFNLSNVGEIFWVKSERTVSKFRNRKENFRVVLTYSIKRECKIRKFHVAIVQKRLRNVQKKRDARAKLFFFLLFAVAVAKTSYCCDAKFCYLGNVKSHFSLFKKRQRAIYLENTR